MDENNNHDDSWLPEFFGLFALSQLYNPDNFSYRFNQGMFFGQDSNEIFRIDNSPDNICQAKQEDVDALMLRNAQRSIDINAITKGACATFTGDTSVQIDHDRILTMLRYIRNDKPVDLDAYDDRDWFSGVGGDIDD